MNKLNEIYHLDCLIGLRNLPDNYIDCCVTSPPYYGLRDYGIEGQLGLEETPEKYVEKMVEIFSEIKRVLKKEGTLWLNIGDSYAASGRGGGGGSFQDNDMSTKVSSSNNRRKPVIGLKQKDLIGIPWMIAFALRADGWYLRSDIIWNKPNPMPESVKDRPTRAHEYIFLLSKSRKYFYDADAIKTEAKWPDGPNAPDKIKSPYGQGYSRDNYSTPTRWDTDPGSHGTIHKEGRSDKQRGHSRKHAGFNDRWDSMTTKQQQNLGANKRTVWTIATRPFAEAHFAVYPQELIIDCIKAGCPENGIVLDPFMGSGTTAIVARKLNRNYIGFELNDEYIKIADKRIRKELGIFK